LLWDVFAKQVLGHNSRVFSPSKIHHLTFVSIRQ
jgi:hypothetical protein